MSRKFSDISLNGKIGLIDLINVKKEKFNSRLTGNQQSLGEQFSSNFTFLPLERLAKLDEVTKQIFELIQANPEVEMDDIIDSLWQDVGQKYSNLYSIIEGFNESGPGVSEIMNSPEWHTFIDQSLRQLHLFDRQNNNSGNYEKLIDLETRTYTLLSLIKSAIVEARGVPKVFELPEGFEEAKTITDLLVENKKLIESGIESSKSMQTFNVNNIDEALKNVGTMFYYKDMYSVFQKEGKFYEKVIEAIILVIDELRKSSIWWFLGGFVTLLMVVGILACDFIAIMNDPSQFKDTWQIMLSIHILGASFLGYLTVFCFGNFKRGEARDHNYKFRGILVKSFGFLLKTADEEQKKILYPKALDAIFKDLPESNMGQDVNINLPVTEIMKGLSGKV